MRTLKTIILLLVALVPAALAHGQCTAGYNGSYNGAASYSFHGFYYDSATVVSGYLWTFGDGATATTQDASHTFTADGDYEVCFSYTGTPCGASHCDTVHVEHCDMSQLYIYPITNGLLAKFMLGGNTYGANLSYQWTIQTPTPVQSTAESFTYLFSQAGTYQVCLTIDNGNGCTRTICDSIQVDGANYVPCSAEFSVYPNPVYAGGYVSFYPTDSMGALQSDIWYFGDGQTSNGPLSFPQHQYTTAGSYEACMVSSDLQGCYDSICHTITVSPPPPPTYSLSGYISDASSTCLFKVLLIQEDTPGHLVLINELTTVDSLGSCGYYIFYGLPAGTYYIKALEDASNTHYNDYLPTYYGDELNWADATPIVLNTHLFGVDVHLIAGNFAGGPGFVGGWVSQGAGLVANPYNDHRGVGDPIPGAQINLLSDNDMPVAFTFTDADGHYSFSNLALGTYKIYAEVLNKMPVPALVTLTANNPTAENVDVSINSTSATTGVNDIFEIKVEGVYPNPVSSVAQVKFNLQQNAMLNVALTDISGRILFSNKQTFNAGNNQLVIGLGNQAAGVYYLTLNNGSGKRVIKLMKTE